MTDEQKDKLESLKQDRETLSNMLEDVCDWLKTGQTLGSTQKVCRFCEVNIYRSSGWTPEHDDKCPVTLFKEWKGGQ